MMKQLTFNKPAIALIISGKITNTWRVNDDKNLSAGDVIEFVESATRKPFAKAKITDVKETIFGNLTEEDRKCRESMFSENGMYDTFAKYYKMKVMEDTPVKVIKFVLI